MRRSRLLVLVGLSCIALGAPLHARLARADDRQTVVAACEAAYDGAQRKRKSSLIAAARDALACSRDECPAVIRRDCADWFEAIQKSMPSIVVRVKGDDGCDLATATVSVDGAVAADRLDGRAIPVEPGDRLVSVEVPGHPRAEQHFVAAEGEKARIVTFGPTSVACGAPKILPEPPVQRWQIVDSRPTPASFYVTGALGLATVGAGAGFEIAGFVRKGGLEDCKPNCSSDDISATRNMFIAGDVLIGVGLAALAITPILWATRPTLHKRVPVSAAGVRGASKPGVTFEAASQGVGGAVRGRF